MQMLLNGGQLDGVRILSRKTVELMMANHLSLASRPTLGDDPSSGFGLGGAVRIDLARGSTLGSVGQFGWTGMATTYANLDPQEKTLALLFVQHLPYDEHKIFWRFSTLAYAAIID
jgi:CubicO group peptidase (beta-lactamase class C family)